MPATSTEIWDGRGYTFDTSPDQAARVWLVINAVDEQEALNAAPEPGTYPIQKRNQQHVFNSFLKVKRNIVTPHEGPRCWQVVAQYEIPPIGDFVIPPIDPLDRPPRISWRPGTITLPADTTVDHFPIVNSAGDSFDPPRTQTIAVDYLTIFKWYTFYDRARARLYGNTVNSNQFQIGNQIFLPGEVYCDSISPSIEYDSTATRIEIAHNFMLCQGLFVDAHPFQLHLKDQGRRGWYSSGGNKLGEFYYKNAAGTIGTQVTEPVPLDGTGKPIDTSLLVSPDGITGYAPIANPNLGTLGLRVDANYSSPAAKVLSFYMVREIDFSGLNI